MTKSDIRSASCEIVETDDDLTATLTLPDGGGVKTVLETVDRNDSIVGPIWGPIENKEQRDTSTCYIRPPLPQSKRQCLDSVARSPSIGENTRLGEFSGMPYLMRPTMLSRVVRVRKRAKDHIRGKFTSDSIRCLQSHWVIASDNKISPQLRITRQEDRSCRIFADELEGKEKVPHAFLSPSGVDVPLFPQSGRAGTTTDDFKRFASPNTASVASALSLLSQLPFYEKSQ